MAKIEEHLIVFKLSRLLKNSSKNKTTIADELSPETLANLEQVVQELVGENLVVEIENIKLNYKRKINER